MTFTNPGTHLLISENQAAMRETLFSPVEGRTADGYVVKRAKKFVDVMLGKRLFRINCWLVWCKGSEHEGKTYWQHAVLDLPYTLTALDDAARGLSRGSTFAGKSIHHTFL